MAGLTAGTRVSYRWHGVIRTGTVIQVVNDRLVRTYYVVRSEASGLVADVLAQLIVTVY